MPATARKARPRAQAAPPRTGASLWEMLGVFAIAGLIAFTVLGYRPTAAAGDGGLPSPLALLPEAMKPVDHHFTGCNQARAWA